MGECISPWANVDALELLWLRMDWLLFAVHLWLLRGHVLRMCKLCWVCILLSVSNGEYASKLAIHFNTGVFTSIWPLSQYTKARPLAKWKYSHHTVPTDWLSRHRNIVDIFVVRLLWILTECMRIVEVSKRRLCRTHWSYFTNNDIATIRAKIWNFLIHNRLQRPLWTIGHGSSILCRHLDLSNVPE